MRTVVIDTNNILLDGKPLNVSDAKGMTMLTDVFKSLSTGYPKYYKMDPLCRLGFIAAELLLADAQDGNRDLHAVVAVGHGGSIADDRRYQETIACADNYFPSPSVFVYTLANIVTGEIAIRHKLYGESSSYLIARYDPETITRLLLTAFDDPEVEQVTGGWIDCESEDNFSLRFLTADRSTKYDEIKQFFENNNINTL